MCFSYSHANETVKCANQACVCALCPHTQSTSVGEEVAVGVRDRWYLDTAIMLISFLKI